MCSVLWLCCADNTTYDSCVAMIDCQQPITITNGVHMPAKDNAFGTWDRLIDIQKRTQAASLYGGLADGTKTTAASTSPYITLTLDAPYTGDLGK